MTKVKEIWKDIPNYEGIYQVSNLGRVKSKKYGKEKILIPGKNSKGYLMVVLYNGSAKSIKVEILVAMAFLGHKPNGHSLVIDHVDHNRLNNNLDNLRIVTSRENASNRKGKADGKYSSKYVGVCWSSLNKKWHSRIRINGYKKHIGYFNSEIEASKSYQKELQLVKTKSGKLVSKYSIPL